MKLLEIIKNAGHALLQNRRRSILTMIGIIVGIASVITILSLGRGFKKYTLKSLQQENTETVIADIYFEPSYLSGDMSGGSFFSSTDISLIKTIPGVEKAEIPKVDVSYLLMDVTLGGVQQSLDVITIAEDEGSEVILGREISKFDNQMKYRVAVISENIALSLSDNIEEVIGQGIKLGNFNYQIIGISSSEVSSDLLSTRELEMYGEIEIPRESYIFYENSMMKERYSLNVSIDSSYIPSDISNQVVELLSEQGTSRALGSYSSFEMSELTDGIGSVLSMLTLFISGIAGISLLIAGVGVMNMMYTSVAERTKEIGIRRAVGASQKDIRNQFLAEGLLLTISSGIIGYLFGFVIAYLISLFLPFRVSVDIFTVSLAIGVTGFIGLVFSIMPANQAAKKDLVEILR